MSHLRTLRAAPFVSALLYLPFHHQIHAYLDPGTGSIVLQAVLGALVAALVAVKLFWNQIKAFFGRLFSRFRSRE